MSLGNCFNNCEKNRVYLNFFFCIHSGVNCEKLKVSMQLFELEKVITDTQIEKCTQVKTKKIYNVQIVGSSEQINKKYVEKEHRRCNGNVRVFFFFFYDFYGQYWFALKKSRQSNTKNILIYFLHCYTRVFRFNSVILCRAESS